MLNLTKRVDYGLIALTHLAAMGGGDGSPARLSVRGAAEVYNMSQPLLANVMKDLARLGFVRSARGTKGGYELALSADQLSVGRVVEALEGPLRLTECMSTEGHGDHASAPAAPPAHDGEQACSLFENCVIKRSVSLIHVKIREALYGITIADLAQNAGRLRQVSERLPLASAEVAGTGSSPGGAATPNGLAGEMS